MPEFEKGSLIVNNEGIFVYASVNNVNVKLMVDSGSRPTIVSRKVYTQMCTSSEPCLKDGSSLKTADGHPLPNLGIGNFHLDMGVIDVNHNIYVADIDEEGLLGFDFLHKYKCNINLNSNKLIVHNPQDQSEQKNDANIANVCHRVAVRETTVIPPNSEQLLSAKLVTKPANGDEMGVLEPREGFVKKHAVMVASTLINPNNDVIPIRVINPTTKSENSQKYHRCIIF
jgi:hypothetical protein